ncbi:MAG: DUF695 domain-containing protein [Bacteroidetes bacterium]|jgi:hypothetical protein|nr:DUF695 domain-containing protein [Bacteroidota bacterium]
MSKPQQQATFNSNIIDSYKEFWNWFKKNKSAFFKVILEGDNIHEDFFDKLSEKLDQVKEGIFYLAGMHDDQTVELTFTVDGNIKNIIFVEELLAVAPKLKGWKFTTLKPAQDMTDVTVSIGGYTFSFENLHFFANETPGYPDQIDICIVYDEAVTDENRDTIANGVYLFLDNYLGELDFIMNIDNLQVLGKSETDAELIPVSKLKEYLLWRQTEFVEKYKGTRHNTDDDHYALLEAELENGDPLFAMINEDLMQWDCKSSHPWILAVGIGYHAEGNRGIPDDESSGYLEKIEDDIMFQLKDYEGYLNVGRQTADNLREIYFACSEFRKPSKVIYEIQKKYAGSFKIDYHIYKDKYWQSFERFGGS